MGGLSSQAPTHVGVELGCDNFVLTRETKLAPGSTVQVYRDNATVQVYSSSRTSGPSKVHVLIVLTKIF